MNKNIEVITRAEEEPSEDKLYHVGAQHVVYPYRSSGRRMVDLLVQKAAVNFYDLFVRELGLELQMGEVVIEEYSNLDNVTLKDSCIREDTGLMVVAVKLKSEQVLFNPDEHTLLSHGDMLLVMGNPEGIEKLHQMAKKENHACLITYYV